MIVRRHLRNGRFVRRHLRRKALLIAGSPSYISYMERHLRREHPSTRRRMGKFDIMERERRMGIVE